MEKAEILIVAGTLYDLKWLSEGIDVLTTFGVPFDIEIADIHRSPERLQEILEKITRNRIKVVIAGASGAAHLPGMIAAHTPIPVIGVPIKAPNSIDGLDAIYSILQMPDGVPVATMALNSSRNAAIFALQILGIHHESYMELLSADKTKIKNEAIQLSNKVKALGYQVVLEQAKS